MNDVLINRYPGVKPFSVSDTPLFFGRETDIDDLNSLIFIKQTVVLYGKSGYGKSSLINAGIIPHLQKSGSWTYFYIRFNNYTEKEVDTNLSPVQTTKQRLSESLTDQPGNILDTLIDKEDSLWYWIKRNQLHYQKRNFVIFFDQFEELFTYPPEQITSFSEQLSHLLYTTIPTNFKKQLANLSNDLHISDEQHDFLYEKTEVKAIFSIRSDRLSLLNLLRDRHPSILQSSYELQALNIHDARNAIVEPAKLSQDLGFMTPSFTFTEEGIQKILTGIANPEDGKIEAATLQIVCRFVEEKLVRDQHCLTISNDDLGDITDIFQQYYTSILDRLNPHERVQAQRLIEDELIEGFRRNPLSEHYIRSKFGINDQLLYILEQSSLLKKERDARGLILYEVSHDSLIGAINKIAQNRRLEEEQKKKLELQKQVEEERERSHNLKLLNDRANTLLSQFKVALLFALLATIAAIYFAFDSQSKKEEAEAQKEIANLETTRARNALSAKEKEEARSKAKDLIKLGDDHMSAQGTYYKQNALMRYRKALEIMAPHKTDSLYFKILDYIKKCEE